MAHFTVIGLGRFGLTASLELSHLGHDVTGVDSDPNIVEKYADDLFQTVCCKADDERALEELDINQSDAVLVAIGENMESSLLCTLYLKNRGIENVWVKATSNAHHSILSKLKVARIIHPEEEMGVRVAHALNYPMVRDYLSLGHGMFVVEVRIGQALAGKSLATVIDKLKDNIRILVLKRAEVLLEPGDRQLSLQQNDTLVLCGTRKALEQFAPHLS